MPQAGFPALVLAGGAAGLFLYRALHPAA